MPKLLFENPAIEACVGCGGRGKHGQYIPSTNETITVQCLSCNGSGKVDVPQIDKSGAIFSECRTWRYQLWRTWDRSLPSIAFVGLNPSTADQRKLDNTTLKCVRWSRRDGYGTFIMLNLFGLVSTDPKGLRQCEDPVGPWTDQWLKRTIDSVKTVVLCYGGHSHPLIKGRIKAVNEMVTNPMCLGVTKGGAPLHPLYLKNSTQIIPYVR